MSLLIEILNQLRKIQRPPKTTVNGLSTYTTPFYVSSLNIKYAAGAVERIAKSVRSGNLDANSPKAILNITGAGELNFFAVTDIRAEMANLTVTVTVDGVQIANIATIGNFNGYLLPVIGSVSGECSTYGERAVFQYDRISFTRSLKIELTSSIASADQYATFSAYKIY